MGSDDEIEHLESDRERLEREVANLRDERLDYLRQHARGVIESEEELEYVGGIPNDKAFEVTMPGEGPRTFDSFRCAIHALAPTCEHCGCKVIGHGVEAEGHFYCCAHCASVAGASGVADRA